MITTAAIRTAIRDHTQVSSAILTDAQCSDFIWSAMQRLMGVVDFKSREFWYDTTFDPTTPFVIGLNPNIIDIVSVFLRDTAKAYDEAYTEIPRLDGGAASWYRYINGEENLNFPRTGPSGYFWFTRQAAATVVPVIVIVPKPSVSIPITVVYRSTVTETADLSMATEAWLLGQHGNTIFWGALQAAYVFLHEMELANAAGAIFQEMAKGSMNIEAAYTASGGPKMRGV